MQIEVLNDHDRYSSDTSVPAAASVAAVISSNDRDRMEQTEQQTNDMRGHT